MSRKSSSASAIFRFAVVLCLMTVADLAAQSQACSDLTSITGQPCWAFVRSHGISTPNIPANFSSYWLASIEPKLVPGTRESFDPARLAAPYRTYCASS